MFSKKLFIPILLLMLTAGCTPESSSKTYYIDALDGSDDNHGLSASKAWKSLEKLYGKVLSPGDRVLLSTSQTHKGMLWLSSIKGSEKNPIQIASYGSGERKAIINPGDEHYGIFLENCSFIEISDISIHTTQPAKPIKDNIQAMRCGILVNASDKGIYEHFFLKNLSIKDIFFESEIYERPDGEVRTANGTENYGWGIRFISSVEGGILKNIRIDSVEVENVGHTGIKLTTREHDILDFEIAHCKVLKTGGPGIQMSGVKNGHIHHNEVDQSGSLDDLRKWGRGSGLWTWGSDSILIEYNRFTNANGPGDSAGAHIDYNCSNVVLQYNFSANNAGGFCEILGNNYNCAYRYNISVNDGHRIKGVNGAFQEGKIFWLSGYTGDKKERKGPFNSYFYNNTIVVKEGLEVKMAIDRVSNGILIANNIFHIEPKSMLVKGDQYNPETSGDWMVSDYLFNNNLFLYKDSWPQKMKLQDQNPSYGNADFQNLGGLRPTDYIPKNLELVKNRGIEVAKIPNDKIGLIYGLKVETDFLGNKIKSLPDLGAIEMN